jgi:hypothetical protein
MRKLEALKVGEVQREEKKKEKEFCELESLFCLFAVFSLLLFGCTSKMISRALGSIPITF